MLTQEALWKLNLFSYPKSCSSSASPSDLLHRSEGSWVLIFPPRDSALPIRAPHVCEAPAGAEGRSSGFCCSSHSPLREASCESPTLKEVKLGYSSHRHLPPWPEALAGVFCQSGSMQSYLAYLWGHPHCITQPAVSVKGNKYDSSPNGTRQWIQTPLVRPDHSSSLVFSGL